MINGAAFVLLVNRECAAGNIRETQPAPFLFGYSLLLPNAMCTDSEPFRFCLASNSRAKQRPLVKTNARTDPSNKTSGKVGWRNISALRMSAARNKSVSERTR